MKKAIIYIYDYIGSESVNSNYIRQIITQYEDQGIDEFELHINSMGGSVFEGIAIFNFLKNKNVTVYIDGVAASIASVVAMAGKKVYMYSSSMIMIHNPWLFSDGESEELRKQADMLDQVKKSIIAAYTEKTGIVKDKLEEMMNAETWMTATEAKKQGFCDEIVKNKSAKNYVAVYAMVQDDETNNSSTNNKGKKMNKKLLAFFGLPENATDDQIEAKLTGVRKDFGLEETATIEDIVAKIRELDDDAPPADPPADPPSDTNNALLQELLEDRAENLVNTAIADFKIQPIDKTIWLEKATKDYKGAKAELDKRAKNSVKPGKLVLNKLPVDPEKKTKVQAATDHFKTVGRKPA